jgi:hypothetical protein
MEKINLVLQRDQFTSFTSHYLEEYWCRHFDISIYDPQKTYGKKGTVFVFWWMNADDELPMTLKDQGYRVAIDHLWEYPKCKKDFYWIEHLDWFRLNESLWWRALGYHQYRPAKSHGYRAFMPINRPKPSRDILYKKIEPLLDQLIWSYGNQRLPGDVGKDFPEWQRFLNPSWYDDTYCSIVAENSTVRVWTTEKSFKPLAFYHPFVVLSAPGHLDKIKSLGFETFDNIFDESYDTIVDVNDRCQLIVDNISAIDIGEYDNETWRRLQHNHDHFFDKTLTETVIRDEILIPLLEYAEA